MMTINGIIIPTILTSITKEHVKDDNKAFLYEGVSIKFIAK